MPRRGSPYGPQYDRVRRRLLGKPCELRLTCDGTPADSADHDPPLGLHTHVPGSGCCVLRPACRACQSVQGHAVAEARRRAVPSPSRRW